jgi:hypothetical protein
MAITDGVGGRRLMWSDAASQECCMENLPDIERSFMYLLWLCENESTYIGYNFTYFSFTFTCHVPQHVPIISCNICIFRSFFPDHSQQFDF